MPLCGALAISAVLTIGQIGPVSPPQPGTRQFWEAQARTLPIGSANDNVIDLVNALRGFAPHVARKPFAGEGGRAGCGTWKGGSFELDTNWRLVRDQGAPTSIAPSEAPRPPSYRIVGLDDLRAKIDPALFDAVRLIHRSPKMGDEFDPVRLIQAVNKLQAMGDEQANQALREYDTLCRTNPCDVWNNLDPERIIWIARLLYPPKPNDSIPEPALGMPDVSAQPHTLPLFPLALQNDIPFCTVSGYLLGGVPEDALEYLSLCRHHGVFRAAPLTPSTDPLTACDALWKSTDIQSLKPEMSRLSDVQNRLRLQALVGAAAVTGDPSALVGQTWMYSCGDRPWAKALAAASQRPVQWDPKSMDFVASVPTPTK
jgi:hypothetical protein